jgi:pimeloyl-ACP methyl ester carboxylesterase
VTRRGALPPPGPGQTDTLVGGVRWRSRELPGKGDPVLFVHGLLASSATWENVLEAASAGRPAIAVDLPGFGCSERPWPYDYSAGGEARSLLEFLDARGIGRAVLVGSSLGGATAMLVAAGHPDRVAALVLVAPATPESRVGWPVRLIQAPVVGEVALALASRPIVAYGLRRWLFADAGRVTAHAIDDAWFPLTIPGTRRAALLAVRSERRRYLGLEARIRVPTLIVWGREDRVIPAAESERLRSRIAGSRLVVLPDAGHLSQREQPQAFSRVVAEFVSGLLT